LNNYLITIIGPTAIGKTALSIALAKHYDCDIISCDSRQFFKEMTIGTAVPSNDELAAAPHHFIQNKSIFEPFSVGAFEKEAVAKLDALFINNNIQIMVGGSGLYVDAVLKGLDEFPEIAPEIRTQIQEEYEKKGLNYLQDTLQELDPNYFKQLSDDNPQTLQNPQRMMRFVEVCLGSGLPYSGFLKKHHHKSNFIPIVIGLEADRNMMYQRINQRVDVMLKEGLLEEAKSVFEHKNLNALQTVGYRELFDYFEDKTSLEFAIEQIKMNTRRFAKRQITWFKRTENVTWFDYQTELTTIIESINSSLIPN
jgi:tRNA dimethylallyltransferase